MSNRIQVLVRLSPELHDKLQAKSQDRGWNKNTLITKLIQSFVESDRLLPPSSESAEPESLALLLQEMQEMNRQIAALQALLFLALSQRLSGSPALPLLGETASSHDS